MNEQYLSFVVCVNRIFSIALTLQFFLYYCLGTKIKGRDNGPVLITEIVLALFDSCTIWFISFQCTPQQY